MLVDRRKAEMMKQFAFLVHTTSDPLWKCYCEATNKPDPGPKYQGTATSWSKTEFVGNELKALRRESELDRGLRRQEKRNFLARAVRANALEIDPEDPNDPNADLIQEVVRSYDRQGNVVRTAVKLFPKTVAMEMDNKMTGDNAPEEVHHTLSGGVMVIPVGKADSLEDWEQTAIRQQDSLRAPEEDKDIIDCELLD